MTVQTITDITKSTSAAHTIHASLCARKSIQDENAFVIPISVLLIGFIALFFKEIEAVISQKDAAQASGIPVRELTLAMMLIMGLVIAVALKAVGGVLIYALIVTPAATALQTSKSLKTMFIVSGLWGMGASVVGLFLAGLFSIPTGACVVLTATAFLVLVRLLSKGEAR